MWQELFTANSIVLNLCDAVLDISQHIQLYQTVLSLLEAMVSNTQTHQLLVVAVHDNDKKSQADTATLATTLKKLEDIAHSYAKTVK